MPRSALADDMPVSCSTRAVATLTPQNALTSRPVKFHFISPSATSRKARVLPAMIQLSMDQPFRNMNPATTPYVRRMMVIRNRRPGKRGVPPADCLGFDRISLAAVIDESPIAYLLRYRRASERFDRSLRSSADGHHLRVEVQRSLCHEAEIELGLYADAARPA